MPNFASKVSLLMYDAGRHRPIEHFYAVNCRIPFDKAFLYMQKNTDIHRSHSFIH